MGVASGRSGYFRLETEAWWAEDHVIWITVPNDSQKLRHKPPTAVWVPGLGQDEGDKGGSSRECCFTSYSLKALLHLFHPDAGLNWAFDGLNTSYPTCLYSSPPKTIRCKPMCLKLLTTYNKTLILQISMNGIEMYVVICVSFCCKILPCLF